MSQQIRSGNVVRSVMEADLPPAEYRPTQEVVSGECALSELAIDRSEDGRIERGIWQITPGVMDDVEIDELFVIISGRVTIEYHDDGTTFEAGPGSMGVSKGGTRTRWTVHETVRKVYQLTLPVDGAADDAADEPPAGAAPGLQR